MFKSFLSNKLALSASVILLVLIILALFAPVFTIYDPNYMKISQRLQSPSAAHIFGTDEFGRDLYARVIYGGRISLLVGFLTVLISGATGVTLGVLAGFFKKFDNLLTKIIDAMMAFPDILLAISLVTVLGPTLTNVVIALSIAYTPRFARIARASTLIIKELPFVEAARALGISSLKIIQRHILKNLTSPIIVQATFVFAHAILAESGLSFLGVGVSPDTPTWGTLINSGQQYSRDSKWVMIFPGVAIVFAVFSLQIMGDFLRDFLDPKLKKIN